MILSEDLKTKAVELGLCTEWTEGWGNPNIDELVQKYIKGIDFCIEKNYPSNEYIKEHFGEVAERHGVYVDKRINLTDPGILVLNGYCRGSITVSDFKVSTIYVRHTSDIELTVEGSGRAFIHLYDNANVNIKSKGKAFVYRYGGAVSAVGNVKVRER